MQVFIGGLTIVEFDALEVGDYACSGSDARAYAASASGVVEAVVLKAEATVGNAAVLFPGCCIGQRAVVGNGEFVCFSWVGVGVRTGVWHATVFRLQSNNPPSPHCCRHAHLQGPHRACRHACAGRHPVQRGE